MKLSTKVLLLIAPIILFSAIFSSYAIYSNQKQALIKLESNALQLEVEQLNNHFQQASSFLKSYSYALTHSDILRQYFLLKDNPYREIELVKNLQSTIDALQINRDLLTSLTITDSNFKLQYYIDNGDDPFAMIDPEIIPNVQYLFNQTGALSHTGYMLDSQGEGILVKFVALDKRTLSTPMINEDETDNNVSFLIFTISLEPFNQLKRVLEYNYQTAIVFTETPSPLVGEFLYSVKLSPDFVATVEPAAFLLKDKLDTIWMELLYACLGSAFITIILLLSLLHFNVVRPISKLDTQLKQVESKTRTNIDVLDSHDELGRLSVRFFDMYQELDKTYQQTKTLAETDQLTKLSNRIKFQSQIDQILQDQPKKIKFSVLYIDLDNFKFVNDKYGHQVGDSVLVNFANNLISLCHLFHQRYQSHCIASRLSGDEFSVFISEDGNTNRSLAEMFSRQLLAPLQHGFITAEGTFPITASIGIASSPEDGYNSERLISNADTAMYQAKHAGKNRYARYSIELNSSIQRRSDIEHALRTSDLDKEFSLVFMPYFNQSGKHIVGVEALLRWHSLQLGFVSPEEFIPIAEQTGLFERVDRWVIRNSFAHFNQLQQLFQHDVQLAVNLSSAELGRDLIATFISEQAQLNSIPHHLIDFEITETYAAEVSSSPLLDELSFKGFQLAVDDFGSGYTSLVQLVKYPVQKIKLDRLFLLSLVEKNKMHILKPLIELCHSQSMLVTAEGIENASMHKWLTEANCDLMQGFYFGKPLSLEQLREWNSERQKEIALT